MLGHVAGSQISIRRPRSSSAETYDADQLAINYRRDHLMACPKIAITNRPGKTLYYGIEAGWFISLIQTDTLRPEQIAADSNRDSKVLASLGINDQGAVASTRQKLTGVLPSEGFILVLKVGCYMKAKPKTAAKVS